ncbi:hypothetical protein [Burkholderia sp. CF099]
MDNSGQSHTTRSTHSLVAAQRMLLKQGNRLKLCGLLSLAQGMEKKLAQRIVSSAHRAAEAIANARADLLEVQRDQLYSRVFIGLLEDNVGAANIGELIDSLARP